MSDWRPKNWHRKLPRKGSRLGPYKLESTRESIIARFAFEAGANAMMQALEAEGRETFIDVPRKGKV